MYSNHKDWLSEESNWHNKHVSNSRIIMHDADQNKHCH